MNFNYPGYGLKLIQRQRCLDGSPHLFTNIYKYYSPVTKYFYIARAEYHEHNTFAVKFYCKKDRKSEFKYSKIVNRGDCGNIVISCAMVIPILLQEFPTASFAFAASRSVDVKKQTIEGFVRTQRFKLYAYVMPLKFGFETFDHYAYDEISCYLLHNKQSQSTVEEIQEMFSNTYSNLMDIGT